MCIRDRVYSGAVVGLGTPAQTVAEVRECVDAGYQRIKLKVAPGRGLPAALHAVGFDRVNVVRAFGLRAFGSSIWRCV